MDAETGLAHSLETTAANVSDVATAHAVLHGDEEEVRGDAGYQGVGKRDENKDAEVDWRTAMKPGRRRQLDKSGPEEAAEKRKASVRAKVEHPFLYVKRHFGYAKVRYRGLAKNRQADRAAAGFREPDDRRPLRDGLNAGPLRPFPAETAGNGAEGDEFAVSAAISETIGNTFRRGMDSRSRSACPTPYGVRRPGLIRPSLGDLLTCEADAGRRVLAGFDFPFGYPAGVASHLTGCPSGLELWGWLSARIEDSATNANNRFAVATEVNHAYPGTGPFWGRPAGWP